MNEFFKGIVAFGEHLGSIFIQVSETFSPKRNEELFEFLKIIAERFAVFLWKCVILIGLPGRI